jgi:glycosyltransferase involved in cell wall biosynthesis
MKLSIIVPAYNEEKRIEEALSKAIKFNPKNWTKEIIVVNDGSTDKTIQKIKKFENKVKIIDYKNNRGKGFAIRQGIKKTRGDFILIQDADLEYDPIDLPIMLEKTGNSDAIYGSRFLGEIDGISIMHLFGNKFLSLATSVLYGQKITDMETGYKLIRSKVMKDLNLKSDNFDIEPEITVKLLKKGIPICEVPIHYVARKKEEKKISVKDGIKAFTFLLKNKFN